MNRDYEMEDSVIEVIKDLRERVEMLERKETSVVELSEMSGDIGLIQAGEIRVHTDPENAHEPGDGFSGVRILGAFEYNDKNYAIVGVNSDTPQFGLSAEDGAAFFCAGNATIDSDGISGTDLLKWMIRQSATYDEEERYGQLGMEELSGTPAFTLSFYEEDDEAEELVNNGDFETGDYTGWTKTTETNFTYSMSALGGGYGGSDYAATGFADEYGSVTGVLTSDRTEISEGNFQFSGVFASIYSAGNLKIEIKWYDHASAGSLISTIVLYNGAPPSYWGTINYQGIAPSGALSAVIIITTTGTKSEGNFIEIFIDNISLKAVPVSNKLQLTDTALLYNGESVLTDKGGKYTPTLYGTTNVAASTAYACRYMRFMDFVLVSGQVAIDPTNAALTVLDMSLPVASTLSNAHELSGCLNGLYDRGIIIADTTNNRASLRFVASDTANRSFGFFFTYEVI